MGILDFLGTAIVNGFKSHILEPITSAPADFGNNVRALAAGTAQNAQGNLFPMSDAEMRKKLIRHHGDGVVTYLVTEKIKIIDKTSRPNAEKEIPAGSFITFHAAGNRLTGGPGIYDSNLGRGYSIFDGFSGFLDINGDAQNTYGLEAGGPNFDGLFTDEYGRFWTIINPTHTSLDRLRNTGVQDRANIGRLPYNFQQQNGSEFAYTTAAGEWKIIRKPLFGLDNQRVNASNPLFGFLSGGSGSYFDPSNPYSVQDYQLNTINMLNTPTTTTTLKAVPAAELTTNTDYQTLRNWLLSGQNYQAGTLSGYGPWALQYGGKPVTNAYVNQLGELLVEYA